MDKFITASVGIGGRNKSYDVLTVQDLLNQVPPGEGGPVVKLKFDGICGPKTKKAIQNFQLHHFGWPGADGRVDPKQQTISKLNEYDRKKTLPPPGKPPKKSHPPSTRFVIVHAGDWEQPMNSDRDFFFKIYDLAHPQTKHSAIYWFGKKYGYRGLGRPDFRDAKGGTRPSKFNCRPPGIPVNGLESKGFYWTIIRQGFQVALDLNLPPPNSRLRIPLFRPYLESGAGRRMFAKPGWFQLVT